MQDTYTERRSAPRFASAPLLGRLDLELTERCNNACLHCTINRPAADASAQRRELTTAEWQDVLCQAAELGALSVRFTGGEPLLRDDFAALYLFARRLGLRVTLFTNARLITPEIADLFARIPPLEKIEVSAYGMTPETYEAAACAPSIHAGGVHADGAFAEFRAGVERLAEREVPFLLKSALLPQNAGDEQALDAWAASAAGMREPPAYAMFYDLRARRDSAARNRLIRSLRVDPVAGVAFQVRRNAHYQEDTLRFCQGHLGPAGDTLFTCGAGKSICVDAYGMVQPCLLLRDPALASSLRRYTLREALTGVFPRLRDMRAADPRYLERCAKCFLRGLCDQCPAKSWMEHGTLDTPVEYLCQVAHARARYLGLLGEGEHGWEVPDWQQRLVLLTRLEKGETR